MKKLLALTLGLLLLFSAACGNSGAANDASDASDVESTEPAGPVTLKFGESVKTEMFEFKPEFKGFAKELENAMDENYLTTKVKYPNLPDNPFLAGSSETMIYFSGTVSLIGDTKEDQMFELEGCEINFDDGYKFDVRAFAYGLNKSEKEEEERMSSMAAFKDSRNIPFKALSTEKTRTVRFATPVPKQLQTDTGKSLTITFKIEGVDYTYVIR